MKERIRRNIEEAIAVKQALLQGHLDTVEKAASLVIECIRRGSKLIFFGNGGSASDSQHLAAEFVGRYEGERKALPAIAFTTDTSILTAVGNDYGFDRVFERQVEALARPGDVIFAISTSGNSKNVIAAVKKARQLKITTVGFLGRDGGQLKSLVDLAFVVPSQKTSRIQECHIMIGHILCEEADEALLSHKD